jgi:ADP-heptose:LPS heptosyltransferase
VASRALTPTGTPPPGTAPRLHAVAPPNLCADHRLGNPLPEHVAVVRALPGIGDMLCAIPALRALRAALPHARVTVVGTDRARPVLERFPQYVDDLLAIPGFDDLGDAEDLRAGSGDLPSFLAEASRHAFDLAIQLHGSGGTSNGLTLLLGAKLRAGTYPPGGFCPDPARFVPLARDLPEIRRLLRVLDTLGIPSQGEYLEFPVKASDRDHLAALPQAATLRPGEYVVVHPGSSTAERRWPARHFATMVDLLGALRLPVVLTGTASDRPVVREVAGSTRTDTIDLSGRTTLGTLGALVEDARLVLCNDTGVSHLAAALRVPSVVVFTGSEMGRWAPLATDIHRAIEPAPGLPGVEDVLGATLSLLGGERCAA